MPKASIQQAEQLEQRVCAAVGALQRETGRRYISVDEVRSQVEIPLEQLDAVIALACKRGWLNCAGQPPHTVELTRTGKEAIARLNARR